jgi:hypothetical protein
MTQFRVSSLPLNTSSLVPLHFFRAKDFRSPSSFGRKKEPLQLAYHIKHWGFRCFVRGKMLRHAEMPSEICSLRPYLSKICFSWSCLSFNLLFCCVLAGCLRHAETFFPYPKPAFFWQVEKFWEVRAVKKKVANAIIH